MIYFTELDRTPVFDAKGELLGHLSDMVVDASRDPPCAGGGVIAIQRPLAPLVQLAASVQRQRAGGDGEAQRDQGGSVV